MKQSFSDNVKMPGRIRFIGRDSRTGKVVEDTGWITNLVMNGVNTGVNRVAQEMCGLLAGTIEIKFAEIGTGTTPVADSDIAMQTPTNMVSTGTPVILRGDQEVNSNNVAHVEFFISDSDLPNGTYTEWSLWCGTYGVDAHMMAHAIAVPSYTKATGVDTTVVHEIAINN